MDLALARRIGNGSLPAWHEFIERYTGLIKHSIAGVIHDREEIATVYVAVLEQLYKRQLRQFRGESRLVTWLVVVARSAALDHLRKRRGRQELPARIQELGEEEQQLYRLRFEQGMSLDAIRHELAQTGVSADGLGATLGRIDALLTPAKRRRLAWELQARQVGAESGRLLAYLEEQRLNAETRMVATTPEARLLEKEALATARQVRAALDGLGSEDRDILTLRFDRGWSARQIAKHLSLSGPRRAYTLIETALRRVRQALFIDLE